MLLILGQRANVSVCPERLDDLACMEACAWLDNMGDAMSQNWQNSAEAWKFLRLLLPTSDSRIMWFSLDCKYGEWVQIVNLHVKVGRRLYFLQ